MLRIKKGFSLIEAMLSLVVLSVVLVMTASLITKKIEFKSYEGIVYTYQTSNATGNCYVLNKAGTAYEITKDCSEYVFEVPAGVTKVNLTLVAGGGGGAGGYAPKTLRGTDRLAPILFKIAQEDTSPSVATVLPEYLAGLRNLTINYMTAQGASATNGNVSTCTTSSICTDAGKRSSSAIIGYEFDEEILKQIRRVDKLTRSSLNGKVKAISDFEHSFDDGAMSFKGGFNYISASTTTDPATAESSDPEIKCAIKTAEQALSPACQVNDVEIPMTAGVNNFVGVIGQPSHQFAHDSVQNNTILQGGIGGKLSRMPRDVNGIIYGSGANGMAKKITCPMDASSCAKSDALTELLSSTKSAGNGLIEISYDADLINEVTPSGGTGGAVLRTLDFPVNAGEKYIIRVGKGGTGGMGSVSETLTSDKTAITGWEDAKGGSSTSIYKLNGTAETLVYLVNGGMQGKMSNQPSYITPQVMSSSANYINLLNLDTRVNSKDTSGKNPLVDGVESIPAISGTVVQKLIYPFMLKQPYKRLNSPVHNTQYEGGAILRAFSAFPKIYTSSGADIQESASNELEGYNYAISDSSTIEIYDGLFPRRIIDNEYAYIGGLGGFSGLGSKAGCGGFFNGNTDARTTDDVVVADIDPKIVMNKIYLIDTFYKPEDYFEGCKNTADGGTAKFVAPDYKKQILGQAGSGGGAGGYSIKTGAGKGGDGQNGYVMIEWRK